MSVLPANRGHSSYTHVETCRDISSCISISYKPPLGTTYTLTYFTDIIYLQIYMGGKVILIFQHTPTTYLNLDLNLWYLFSKVLILSFDFPCTFCRTDIHQFHLDPLGSSCV